MALLQAPNIAQQIQTASNTVPQTNLLTQQGFEAQQRANYLEEQAKATDLANQKTQMFMPLLQNGVNQAQQMMQGSASAAQTPNISPPNEGKDIGGIAEALQPQGTASQDAPTASTNASSIQDSDAQLAAINAHVDKWAQKFAPPPMAMDAQTAKQLGVYQMLGKAEPQAAGLADMVQTQWNQKQELAKQNAQRDANLTARNAYAIMKAPDSRAAFESIDHEDAKMLSPNMTDAQIKQYAQHVYRAAFPWTGRSAEVQGGNFVDPLTGEKISDARVSLSQEQWAKINEEANDLVDYPISGVMQKIRRYQATGYPNADAYAKAMGGITPMNAGSGISGSASAAPSPAGLGSSAPPTPPGTQLPGGLVQAKPNTPDGMVLGQVPKGQVTVDMSQFPDAPVYPKTGTLLNTTDYDAAQKAKYEVATTATNQKNLANRSLYNERQMLGMLDNVQTGPGSHDLNQALGFFRTLNHGDPTVLENFVQSNPAQYRQMDKWLSDIGVQTVGQDIAGEGATARFSAMLTRIGLDNLAANVEMPKEAIRTLLKYYTAGSMYNNQKWGDDYSAAAAQNKNMAFYDHAYSNVKPFDQYLTGTISHMDNYGNVKLPTAISRPAAAPIAASQSTAPAQPDITEDAYIKLKSGTMFWFNGKQYPKK